MENFIKDKLNTGIAPNSGWCPNPSQRVLKALNDQFGEVRRSVSGPNGVAWHARGIWKIIGSSSYKKIDNSELESLLFSKETIPQVTLSVNSNTFSNNTNTFDGSRLYDDGSSSINKALVATAKDYTQERTPIQNWNFAGQDYSKPEVKDPNDYSLQEPMIMKKVDKKRKLIIS